MNKDGSIVYTGTVLLLVGFVLVGFVIEVPQGFKPEEASNLKTRRVPSPARRTLFQRAFFSGVR
jgi:hypothetical protein